MATSEGQKPEANEILIDWNGAAQTRPVQHVNQVVIQIVEHELNLAFFQFNPPVVIAKNPQEVVIQLQGLKSITPDCVARINMSARAARGLIRALQEQFDENGSLKGDDEDED